MVVGWCGSAGWLFLHDSHLLELRSTCPLWMRHEIFSWIQVLADLIIHLPSLFGLCGQ